MSDPAYFFLHLQKTAGTSVFRMLKEQFGDRGLFPHPDDGGLERVFDMRVLEAALEERGEEIKVVAAHFPFVAVDLLPAGVKTFTILREPVARTLSFLRHQQVFHPELKSTPIEELYAERERFTTLIENHQTKMLCMDMATAYPGGLIHTIDLTENDLARAIERLESIDVVGVMEHFGDFIARLEQTFGWDLGPIQFSNRTGESDVSEEFIAKITTDNQLDVRLYEHAAAMCEPEGP